MERVQVRVRLRKAKPPLGASNILGAAAISAGIAAMLSSVLYFVLDQHTWTFATVTLGIAWMAFMLVGARALRKPSSREGLVTRSAVVGKDGIALEDGEFFARAELEGDVPELSVRGRALMLEGETAELRRAAALLSSKEKRAPRVRIDEALLAAKSGGGYRVGAVAREDMMRVVEDPRAPPKARVAAAAALARGMESEERARVRVAAESSAHPAVSEELEKLSAEPRER
jgi:hypothetical protein